MASSGRAASALSSASCSAFDGLKALFFIYFPFTCRGFPRADDSTHRLTGFEIALGQSVNHKQQNWSDKSDRVPARVDLPGAEIPKYLRPLPKVQAISEAVNAFYAEKPATCYKRSMRVLSKIKT